MTEPQAAADEPRAKAANVLAYSGYVKLLGASFLGALGDRFYQAVMIATANAIFTKDLSNLQAGRVQIFSIVPMLILYTFVGSLVDGYNRRRLLTLLEAIKVVLVLGYVALLWNIIRPGAAQTGELPTEWNWCIGLLILLNVITVPFSPARAAVVPDVLPHERRSMGASLIATAGLFSYLVGSYAGIQLASPGFLGPVRMTFIASGIYLLSSLLFAWLPDEAAVPGNQRQGENGTSEPPRKMSLREYAAEQWDGFMYCFKRPSLLALIFFETTFWTIASMMLTLLFFYGSDVLGLSSDDKNVFIGKSLGLAGLGLIAGALGAGKAARIASPVFTYVPAFLLVIVGFNGVFGSQAVLEAATGTAAVAAPASFYPLLFALALGGGMLLGRVDADVLAISDERYRGRVFAIKAVCFAACTLASLIWVNEAMVPVQKFELMHATPRVLLWLSPLVFIFAWLVDTAIWSHHAEVSAPNFRRRMQFKLCRFISWCWLKLHFRFTVVGAEKVPLDGPVILVANHGSFLDPLFLGVAAPRMTQFMMYRSYYESAMHPLFRWLSCIPVDENKHLQALKTGVASLEKGACIGIFPEGQVAYEKKLYPPQGGAIFLAQRSGAPIVPMAIKGDWDVLPRGARFPKFKKVTAVFGEPFTVPRNLSKQETAEVTRKMMAAIAEMLGVPPPEEQPEPAEK
ncbi:MAG TPA: MFS transporter [Planctomycetota bacterium]|nr:MFS transporter [Planctomycetota bacterium]